MPEDKTLHNRRCENLKSCTGNRSFENMAKSKHLATALRYQNLIGEKIKSRLN
jgi:hypothetical protein